MHFTFFKKTWDGYHYDSDGYWVKRTDPHYTRNAERLSKISDNYYRIVLIDNLVRMPHAYKLYEIKESGHSVIWQESIVNDDSFSPETYIARYCKSQAQNLPTLHWESWYLATSKKEFPSNRIVLNKNLKRKVFTYPFLQEIKMLKKKKYSALSLREKCFFQLPTADIPDFFKYVPIFELPIFGNKSGHHGNILFNVT